MKKVRRTIKDKIISFRVEPNVFYALKAANIDVANTCRNVLLRELNKDRKGDENDNRGISVTKFVSSS